MDSAHFEAALRQLGAMQPRETVLTTSGLMWLLQIDEFWVLVSKPYKQRMVAIPSSWSRVVKSMEGSAIMVGGYTPVAFRSLVMGLETPLTEQIDPPTPPTSAC